MNHTPSPWDIGMALGDVMHIVTPDCHICEMANWDLAYQAERDANARLIAAAPDLLEALQGVLRVADRATDEFDAARAAIAKAIGETV